MQVNVSQLLKAPIGSTRDYEVSEIIDIAGSDHLVQGKASLIHTNQGILVKCTLHTEIEVICSRCLRASNYPLALSIEEEFFPTTDVVSGTLLPLPDEPGSFTIDEHHILDLTEAIQQYALLAAPMKPLCREDCAGLCPTCGHDFNQGPCSCAPQETDLRWSELRDGLSTLTPPSHFPFRGQEKEAL